MNHTYTHEPRYTHMNPYIHTWTHTHTHEPIHTHMNHTYTHEPVHTHEPIHAHMNPYIHTWTHTYTHEPIRTHMNPYVHTWTHTYTHGPIMHTWTHICTHEPIHAHMNPYMHTCKPSYIHTPMHAHVYTLIAWSKIIEIHVFVYVSDLTIIFISKTHFAQSVLITQATAFSSCSCSGYNLPKINSHLIVFLFSTEVHALNGFLILCI